MADIFGYHARNWACRALALSLTNRMLHQWLALESLEMAVLLRHGRLDAEHRPYAPKRSRPRGLLPFSNAQLMVVLPHTSNCLTCMALARSGARARA